MTAWLALISCAPMSQAEVQSLHADSSIILHTRSSKFGKVMAATSFRQSFSIV